MAAATGWDLSRTTGEKTRQLLNQAWAELHSQFWDTGSQVGGVAARDMPDVSRANTHHTSVASALCLSKCRCTVVMTRYAGDAAFDLQAGIQRAEANQLLYL